MSLPGSVNSISVFFPAFNDEATIAALVGQALAVLADACEDYEVIVVDDGSTDRTPEVIDALARSSRNVRVVRHQRNRGYGAALRSGFDSSSKDLIFYTDGDGQYDVRELAALLPLMSDAVDAVNGYKLRRADGLHRALIGGVYNRLARLLFRLPVRDVDCDFRLIRRSALRRIALNESGGAVCVELVLKLRDAGCVFAEAPVHHYPRTHGRSQFFTPRRAADTAFRFLALWFRLVIRGPFRRAQPPAQADRRSSSAR